MQAGGVDRGAAREFLQEGRKQVADDCHLVVAALVGRDRANRPHRGKQARMRGDGIGGVEIKLRAASRAASATGRRGSRSASAAPQAATMRVTVAS